MFGIKVNGIIALTVSAITAETVAMASCAYRMMNPGEPIFDLEIVYP